MKPILKKVGIGLVIILLLILGYGWMHYAADRSFEELKEKWAYENSQFLEMDGMPVHYRINGTGAPLVLIHGTGASLHTWERWTELLENDFQIISLDIPAFGLTGPNPERNYSLDFYAKFLNRFLEKIEVDNFSLAGNSLGGAIAWKYASLFPEKVKKLVLIDAAGFPKSKKIPLVFRLAKNKLFGKIMKKISPKSMFKKSVIDVYYDDDLVTPEIVNRYYELALREGNRQAFVDRINLENTDETSEIAKIKTPTLILWGKHDAWISVDNAYQFEKAIEGSKVIIYENAGHVPMEEIPNETAKDTRKFLLKNQEIKFKHATDSYVKPLEEFSQ